MEVSAKAVSASGSGEHGDPCFGCFVGSCRQGCPKDAVWARGLVAASGSQQVPGFSQSAHVISVAHSLMTAD